MTMNHETESMARITAQRAVYDAGEYYRRHSLRDTLDTLYVVAILSFGASLVAFYWLAGVM
jgi:hypothetical protein